MHLPILKNEKRYVRRIINFGGINKTQSFSDGEMTDCHGISHISFPALTQRQKSEKEFLVFGASAAIFGNKECIASSEGLFYDREKVGELSGGEKHLAIIGNMVVVFPDKMYYDIEKKEFSSLEAKSILEDVEVTFSENSITVPSAKYTFDSLVERMDFPENCKIVTYGAVTENEDGTLSFTDFSLKEIKDLTKDSIFCEKCEKNQYRTVISIQQNEDKSYSVVSNLITYKNEMENIFSSFRSGDVIEISGCKTARNNKMATVYSIQGQKISFPDGTFSAITEEGKITLKRKIPDFTSVCSYENRLWGCEGNTIYASALGDPFNFFVYRKLSTDSFSVQSNTEGDFTACTVYGNYCMFFKENACYKLYGNKPSNFSLTKSFSSGIPKTEKDSIAIFNGKMFYNGNGGVYSFYGGIPTLVSQKIEGITMKNAVAGCDGKRYYISADTPNGREEFVYDIERALWSKTGRSDAKGYSYYNGSLHRFTEDAIEKITDMVDEDAQWEVIFCPFDEGYYKTKNYSRIYITARLFDNAWLMVEEKTDNGQWRCVMKEYGSLKKHINIPFSIKSCHETQLRLSGKGRSIIESITREFSVN